MAATFTARQVRFRYLITHGMQWLTVGLFLPINVLLPLDRGLSLPEFGMVAAVQGAVVVVLELPSGGLADVIGRRPVLLLAGIIHIAATTVLLLAHSTGQFLLMSVLYGTYMALNSGPLDSWYVDTATAAEPGHDIDRGLSMAGALTGVAIGGGALLSGALITLNPVPGVEALAQPVLATLVVGIATTAVMSTLIVEDRRRRGATALAGLMGGVSGVMSGGLRLAGRSQVLRLVIAVELFWGFGMIAFEVLMPVRLAEVLRSGTAAAALMGPVTAGAWLASALGAALVPWVIRRIDVAVSAAAVRILHGATVIAMGVLAGPVGVIAAFLACLAAHGAANPLHFALLHRHADDTHRATIVSLNSLVSRLAGALGVVVLGALVSATTVTTGMLVAAVALAAAAPLYLATRRPRSLARHRLAVRRVDIVP